jgi:hypothetical protein
LVSSDLACFGFFCADWPVWFADSEDCGRKASCERPRDPFLKTHSLYALRRINFIRHLLLFLQPFSLHPDWSIQNSPRKTWSPRGTAIQPISFGYVGGVSQCPSSLLIAHLFRVSTCLFCPDCHWAIPSFTSYVSGHISCWLSGFKATFWMKFGQLWLERTKNVSQKKSAEYVI